MIDIIDNDILYSLNSLPSGDVFLLAPKLPVTKGFGYYMDGRVQGIEWADRGEMLRVLVRGTRLYDVSIFVEDDTLAYHCNCPAWSIRGHCKHVVCAVMTVKNLLNPDNFKKPKNTGREELLDALLSAHLSTGKTSERKNKKRTAGKEPDYSIIVEKGQFDWIPTAHVCKGTRRLTDTFGSPVELHSLIDGSRRHSYYTVNAGNPLLEYLKKHGNTYPFFLKLGDKKVQAEWDKDTLFSSKTEVDLSDGNLLITRVCTGKEAVCREFYVVNDNIVVDLERNRICEIEGKDGWRLWKRVSGIGSSSLSTSWAANAMSGKGLSAISIPVDNFNKAIQLEAFDGRESAILEEHLLKFRGVDARLARKRVTHRLTIEKDDGKGQESFVLKACMGAGMDEHRPSSRCFPVFAIWNDRYWDLPTPMRAKKRRRGVVEIFLRLLRAGNKKDADKVIKESLTKNDLFTGWMKTNVKKLLFSSIENLNTESARILFGSDGWYLVDSDIRKEALLYTIPHDLFGMGIFEGMMSFDEMRVSPEKLFEKLPALHQRLGEEGIELLFKGKPVSSVSWDFTFDAVETAGIDWFEIRPEIRCNGKVVDKDTWRRVVAGNGFVEDDGVIKLLDSNSREILGVISGITPQKTSGKGKREIVQVPRLQILDWVELRKKGVRVNLPHEVEAVIGRLMRLEKIEERPLPETLHAKLRHYQQEGYCWLSFLYENRFGACLADDMGLGKTLQTIMLMAGIKEGKVRLHGASQDSPHLVVVPPSILFNWQSEIEKFCPDLKVCFYAGVERNPDFSGYDVVLTTYGLVRRDIEKLTDIRFNLIVFDEAQAVKNIYAATTGAVRLLNGCFKLAVTGTPLENHLGEYHSIMDLVLPGLLGDYDDFRSHQRSENPGLLEMIIRRTRPFVLRRTKEEILKELPPKTESDIYLELTDIQKGLYKKTVEMIRRAINDAYEKKTQAQAQIIALTAILKLRQLCISPRLLDPSVTEASPKIEFLCTKLTELLEEGHSALVFSQFTSFLDIVEKELAQKTIPFSRLDGSTPVIKRKRLVESFQNGGDASVFLLSLKAGGQGLNLTKASYVFHLDPWWNPAVENQASDRAHRIGQKNKVTITRILMRHTIEEKMMKLKEKKLALFKAIMDGTGAGKKGFAITKEDFEFLLG